MFGFQLKDSQPKENSRITFHGQLVLFSNKQCSSQAHTCLAHKNTCLWAVHLVPLQAETVYFSACSSSVMSETESEKKTCKTTKWARFLNFRSFCCWRQYIFPCCPETAWAVVVDAVSGPFLYCKSMIQVVILGFFILYIIIPHLWDKDYLLGCFQSKVRKDSAKIVLTNKKM